MDVVSGQQFFLGRSASNAALDPARVLRLVFVIAVTEIVEVPAKFFPAAPRPILPWTPGTILND